MDAQEAASRRLTEVIRCYDQPRRLGGVAELDEVTRPLPLINRPLLTRGQEWRADRGRRWPA